MTKRSIWDRISTDAPGNKRDRERYAALTEWEQAVALKIVDRLYDGTRTRALCWKIALEVVEVEG